MRTTAGCLRMLQLMACWLICQTTFKVVFGYHDYFPPNFRSDFLLGRADYFFGYYQAAFYIHILVGPVTLIAGLALLSEKLRSSYPAWHRFLGRAQVACVLLVAVSGLWMARYAATGTVAAAGFAASSLATGISALLGWRAALQRRFHVHRWWMFRCYVLLCSAVVLRVIGGLSEVLGLEGTYPIAAWISWLVPLAAVECYRLLFFDFLAARNR